MKARSLYVHFPFCEKKCHYCDFYSLGGGMAELGTSFEDTMETESWLQAPLLDTALDTIFFGGGTPTLTEPRAIERFLKPLWRQTKLQNTEWTTEANPSSITLEKMKELRALGLNRVSIGVQSLEPRLLELLGRVHSRERAFQAIEATLNAGFENVSVDLLCGVPGQTLHDLEASLTALMKYPFVHLSCYLLTLSEENPLFTKLPNEDTQLEHLLFMDRWLETQGFEHYEISNFARPGFRSRHNLNYWKGESYLGLGPSAHSFDAFQKKRWKNVSSLKSYIEKLSARTSPIEWTETLTPEQLEIEKWMLALRLSDGFPNSWLDSPARKFAATRLQDNGLLASHPALPGNLRLTAKGFALSDGIVGEFI